ncbi:DUF1501 domain-containing protein [Jiulongibacter sp. NS-SX5]|uniref:DUF1501 domain-containing protein n=1 Tax=Jiulongibacter sp. NS-SX5 TaxID=3463854 RepID=UPI0040592C7A
MEKIIQEAISAKFQEQTRRNFLKETFMGLGGLAMGGVFSACGGNSALKEASLFDTSNPLMARAPHFAPKARSVIYIHMAGAPSQLELFDYKPELQKLNGMDCPQSLLEGKKFAFIRGVPKMLGPQAKFSQHGDSGSWISNYMPHLQSIADELTFIKTVTTDQFNHAPAQLLMHTGSARLGRPSMGSWVTYGLGTENADLPGFVVLNSGGANPDAGKSIWGSGFLPSVYQGVQCRSAGDPILFLNDPEGMSRDLRKASIETINKINEKQFQEYGDPETLSRISQYEMAYRMQISVPEVMNINDEPDYIHEMYGTKPGKAAFSNNALLARKLVEKGVRFIQLFDWGWDTHGTSEDGSIDVGLVNKCRQTDKAVTALILDLKQRGLLDETLVVWGGEFGRTPMAENREGKPNAFKGRDHHAEAFTMFMAGGGMKKGYTHGETDEIGYSAISGKVTPYDIQATILNQLGFDHEKLTYEFQGRPFRLTDVEGEVIKDILS